MNIDEKIASLTRYLVGAGATRVVLFGSRARGDHRERSDIDLAVAFDTPLSFRDKRQIKDTAETLTGLYSLDLIFLDEADDRLKQQIETDGKILHEEGRPAAAR